MPKVIVPNQNTNFDPLVNQLSSIKELGLTPVSSENKFSLNEQSDQLNSFSNIKASNYGDKVSLLGSDSEAQFALDEHRAQQQSATEQLFKGLGHIGSTIGTEILKTPGYVLGGLGALSNGKSVIENIVNNDWVNAMEKLDTSIKDQIPVYLTKEVQEGNIGRKLMSSAWWATTGADGIGFLLSMYAPGQLLKAASIGTKIGGALEALAAETKLSKVLTATNILTKDTFGAAKMTAKGIARAESTASVMANTYIEAASEAANTFDNVKKTYMESHPDATDEEGSKLASDAASSVMKANVALLVLSNVFDEAFLFKGFGRSAEEAAAESTLGKIFKNGVINKEALDKLKKGGVKEFLKEVPMELAKNGAKEGLFEEGLQFQIQNHYENKAAGKTKAGFTEDVLGNYFENLMTSPEMQESVVLGGILGGGASMFGVASDIKAKNEMLFGKGSSTPSFLGKLFNKKNKTESKGLLNIMNENFINSTRTIHDIADIDENGKPVIVNGKIQVNEEKLKNMMDQKEGLLILSQLHNLAILEGNKNEEKQFGDMLTYNYFLPFLQQEGGHEVLKKHISNQLVELMSKKQEAITNTPASDEKKAKLKEQLLAKADEYQKVYDEVNTTSNTEIHVPVDEPSIYDGWKNTVRDRKMQSLVSYNSAKKALDELELKFPTSTEEPDFDKMSPVQLVEHHAVKEARAIYEKRTKDAKDKYVELSEKKGLQEDYKKFKNKVAEEAKDLEEAVKADTADTEKELKRQSHIEDLKAHAVAQGYNPDEVVILKDANGKNVASFDPKTGKAKDSTGKEVKDVSNLSVASKADVQAEIASVEQSKAKDKQLAVLNEIIAYRTKMIGSNEKEIAKIEKELAEYDEKLKTLQDTIDNLHAEKVNGRKRTKKQLKARKEELENALDEVTKTIDKLQERKTALANAIPRIQTLIAEYEKIRQEIEASDKAINVKEELAKVQEDVKMADLIPEIQSVISEIEDKIAKLTSLKETIEKVLAAHSVFSDVIKLKEQEYENAFTDFDVFFANVPTPYNMRRIHQIITSDMSAVIEGETLAKNNIITNAVEIAKWFNENPDARLIKFNTEEPITELDVYDKMVEIFKPYVANMEELNKQYPYTPEEMYALRDQVFITNRELDSLKQELDYNKEILKLNDTYRRYLALQALMDEQINKKAGKIQNEQAIAGTDKSQQRTSPAEEVVDEPSDMRDIFLEHGLPSTPFSTTGISVSYDGKGKDKTDKNGFPILNENEFQKLWFQTIDELADTITDYTLTPVKATYDDSDDIQKTLAENFPDEKRRTNTDVFVFLTDKDGNKVKRNGKYVFTSVRKVSEVYPVNGKPRVAPDYILNQYLNSIGVNGVYSYENIKDKKIGDFIQDPKVRLLLKDLIDNDSKGEDLFIKAVEYGRKEYQKFLDDLVNNTDPDNKLQVEDVTKGYPLYQLDENGNKRRHPVLDIFKELSLKDNTFGPNQLVGGKLGVIVNTQVKVKGKFIKLKEGSIYLQFDNEDFVVLQARKLNDNEVVTVLHLLSLAHNKNNLNTILVDSPDGYTLNGKNIGKKLPVFFKKSQTGNQMFSLLETMINYGLRAEGKNKKGEIYIQSGNVIFTDFDGNMNSVSLADVVESFKTKDHTKINTLVSFLRQKNFNVNNTMLANNPKFQYPVFKNGKLTFTNNESYYSFLIGEVLTTSSVVKDGYPKKLQRNLVYTPKLGKVSKTPIKAQAAIPVTIEPAKTDARTDLINRQIVGYKLFRKTSGNDASKEQFKIDLENNVVLKQKFIDAGVPYDEAAINEIVDGVFAEETKVEQPKVEETVQDKNDSLVIGKIKQPTQMMEDVQADAWLRGAIINFSGETRLKKLDELAEIVKKSRNSEQDIKMSLAAIERERVKLTLPVEEGRKLTPKERLAKMRGEAVPITINKTPSADKRIDPDELLEKYIKNKIVQKNCK